MRISDWSSDVCSSDLAPGYFGDLGGAKVDISKVLGEPKRWKDILSAGQGVGSIHDVVPTAVLIDQFEHEYHAAIDRVVALRSALAIRGEIGRASCRERVC